MDKWQSIQKFVKPLLPYMISVLVGAGVAFASPIKNWTSGEYVTYSDLNATLNHLHNSVGHNHGPVITAADISASAGIRPEQTTFGSNINKTLVASGTWKINPDGGTYYLPVNYAGTLSLTVTRVGSTGVRVEGAAASGTNADGGSDIYTYTLQPVGFDIADSLYCVNQGSVGSLSPPLHIVTDCYDLYDATWPMSMKNPSGVSVLIYSNAVN